MNIPFTKSVRELKGFKLTSIGHPGKAAIDTYQRDGVVCLRGAFNDHWVETGRRAVAAALRSRTNNEQHFSYQKKGESGKFFYDTFLWKQLPSFQKFTFDSPAADLARRVMRTKSLLLYFDMAIVKEPGTSARTPWHYDEAYWPVAGSQVCNVWTALDYVPAETSLRFLPGSHKYAKNFSAVDFFSKKEKRGHNQPGPPIWEEVEGSHEIVCAELEPGDCLILNFRTHHSAPGNLQRRNRRRAICTHWLGDDASYNNKTRECSPNERGENLVHGGNMECATFPRVF